MTDVSVIGCGRMGSAMVEALRDAGSEVTVWNRTREKAEALAGPRVTVADSPGEALEASPVTLVSVTDYPATRQVLAGEEWHLENRTLVQLSGGLPDRARDLANHVTRVGGHYVDGAVFSYPKAVGTDDLLIIYSGDHDTYADSLRILERLGGTAMHVGDDPGASSALELASVGPAMRMAIAIWQSTRICEVEGISHETFSELTMGLVPAIAEDALQKAADPDLPTDPEKVEVSVQDAAEDVQRVIDYFESIGLDAGVLRALQRLFEAGVEEGRGEHDISCVAELRADAPEPESG